MIISALHKFIFVAIPKTGTHSVRRALRAHMGPQDLEQVGLFVDRRFPFPELREIPHGHINAKQIRPVLGDAVFDSYTKFAFVRNPWERFVSYCAFMSRDGNEFKADPRRYMKWVIREQRPFSHILFRPQSEFVVGANGELEIDIVGRTESMQQSYDGICARLGLDSQPLERANASSHRPYQEYYDTQLRHWVAELYAWDIERFGYSFD